MRRLSRTTSGLGAIALAGGIIGAAFFHQQVGETGLEADVGWRSLALTDSSLNKWAQGLVDRNPDATSFNPLGSGPANVRVTLEKTATAYGCAIVTATIAPMYPDAIPSYDAKLGAEPRETITASREVCTSEEA